MCHAIAHFSGILYESLETNELVLILFIIRGHVRSAILVEYEIDGAKVTQEEKCFNYFPVLHYARAIKADSFIFLFIAKLTKAMILHLIVMLAFDVNGDFL